MKTDECKVITGVCRFSYLYAVNPHTSEEGQTPRYSVSLIIPKTDTATIDKINAAVNAAYETGINKLQGNSKIKPKLETLKTPLRDGDEEHPDSELYAGCYFLNASNTRKPGIVDKFCNPIEDENAIYSGMYGRASISFYAFNNSGNKGIACSLNNLMKTADGERLSGTATAFEDFNEFAETQVDTSTGEVLAGDCPL